MKAYLRVKNNIDKDAIKKMNQGWRDLLMIGAYDLKDLSLVNPTSNHKKGDILSIGEYNYQYKKDENMAPKQEIQNNINSYEVFVDIFNLGKKLNDEIIDDDFITANCIKSDNYSVYFNVILLLLYRNNYKYLSIFIEEIISFFEKYGFVSVVEDNDTTSDNECIILYFLTVVYIIYESFLLREQYANNTNKYSKIYKYIIDTTKQHDIPTKISENLEFLDNCTKGYCTFDTTFDYDNECWETKMIFDNALLLGIYELKMQLSRDNNDETIGICQNPACNNIFKRNGFRQKYCLEYECTLSRQNQRKQKSRNNKNKKSSIK